MKIRELLQTEIWSKRTSRRILIGSVVVVVGFVLWLFVDEHWLTRGERNAARKALLQIDSLQMNALEDDQKDFDARKQRALQAVEAAEHAGWTDRDEQISTILSSYLVDIVADRDQMETDKLLQDRHAVSAKADEDFDSKLKLSGIEVRRYIRMSLHSALDQ